MKDRRQNNSGEEVYTNKELFMIISSNQESNAIANQNILDKLEELVVQVKKTNGSVMDLLLWRATVKGQTWILPIVIGAIVSAIVAYLFKIL